MNYSAEELFQLLNDHDECDWIEAKGGHESSHSVMETVCSFSNEPDLGEGYIIMGFAEDDSQPLPQYKLVNIDDPDKFQSDFVSKCSTMFNIPIRPEVSVEKVDGKTIIKVKIKELPSQQKPLFFKKEGLPSGAYRRIGPTDQRCTEDDMHIFYKNQLSFDQTPISGSSIDDIDENALKRYRFLREKVNPAAEELTYSDSELLEAPGCVNKENKTELNMAGLLLFGSSKALRSNYPMLRLDYIRVPGNTWVSNPDNRFSTIDMRGSLILLLYRAIEAVNADLPKGFLLDGNNLQASVVGLPIKALREAIVNALMHRSYREHSPTQIIRYDNRIEISNPGFSLKSEDKLGEPGSETRNPFIAAVFHDTNLAETKGSGIRAMRRLMEEAHLVPPTFESKRDSNEFTSRLLLHHFLNEEDLIWLKQFESLNLSDGQKQALIFVREVGAIDNQTYRQMADCDTLKASNELRVLRNNKLLIAKGKARATYYIASEIVNNGSAPPQKLSAPPQELSTPPQELSAPPQELSAPPPPLELDKELVNEISRINIRERDSGKIIAVIMKLCTNRPLKAKEIGSVLNKGEDYIKRKYLREMIKNKQLVYLHPDMINHPEQAYITNKKRK